MAPMATGTRERILDASTELFRRQGYAGTGLKAVVAQAGAPFGSLYHHFPGGKDQLAAETIRRAGAEYQAMVGEILLAAPDPVTVVRDVFLGAGETLRQTDWADACPIETVALEVGQHQRRAAAGDGARCSTVWAAAASALPRRSRDRRASRPGASRLTSSPCWRGRSSLDRASRDHRCPRRGVGDRRPRSVAHALQGCDGEE